ncbi:hypothetical protein Q4610_15665 [Sphingobium sp. HBC34]|uniref:Uncharacterized protein n=1 Tax=Sphingobium cyanobacteriorum TaxID=3063954 RepID=A0ABT8ZRY2_9SPHN|nr:hypothetical protein [Sphingobium sp. HBC34]MDO7836485.1 hypothetical protein [Sphingobium sp. HBC34]
MGKAISDHSVWHEMIAQARIDMSRLLTLKTADMMDKVESKGAQLGKRAGQGRAAQARLPHHRRRHSGQAVTPDDVHNRAIARLGLVEISLGCANCRMRPRQAAQGLE